MQVRVLISTTTWFPHSARLGIALAKAGFLVAATCPRGSPIESVRSVSQRFVYRALNYSKSLLAAIEAFDPDLIIPCDDRAVAHLHMLHAQAMSLPGGNEISALIERSIGSPAGFPVTTARGNLMELATTLGLRIPATRALTGVGDLGMWEESQPLPWVLKADGTWGGEGVRIVRSRAEARQAYADLARPVSAARAFQHLVVCRDPFSLKPWAKRTQPVMSVQAFVAGRPANAMLACWKGEVIGLAIVEVLHAQNALGASTIVRTIEHEEIEHAARSLARALGLSGLCGLDFMLDDRTNAASLIEMNPRATQLGHLQLGHGDLASVLVGCIAPGAPSPAQLPLGTTIALFPQAAQCDPKSPFLRSQSVYHDVPWEEPDLVRELVKAPWQARSAPKRLYDCHRARSLKAGPRDLGFATALSRKL